jgi:hypothetical protein
MLRGYDTRVLQHFIKQVQLLLVSELRVPHSANQLSEPVHVIHTDDGGSSFHDELLSVSSFVDG